ncbi:AAA family ATPase [Vibrio methylphosphonaticus]|uniref:AAA family ATPase n=1 Tax=Vibrio methylphosphonaticus TaxID=2946866 RepID=UPI00202AA0F0|nr:AAA family ATPase [Vibrio methylphosphonaticus]MCL9777581.1 AAA family ATPase [Vibrio methylphosphonaticus]
MDSIKVRGLRSLVDTGYVDIKPINVLLGTNSSGKSTFLRVFPLLRQSAERKTRGPILWNGEYTDFESFKTSKYQGSKEEHCLDIISFSFDFRYDQERASLYRNTPIIDLKTTICLEGVGDSCYTNKLSIDIYGHEINFEFESNGIIKSIYSNRITWQLEKNKIKYQLSNTNTIIPILGSPEFHYSYYSRDISKDRKTIMGNVFNQISDLIRKHTGSQSKNRVYEITSSLVRFIMSDEDKLKILKSIRSTNKWKSLVESWNIDTTEFVFLAALADLYTVTNNSMDINSHISETFRNVRYIAPLRASTERYYRYQDLSIDEIDHRGENIGMFLTNIPKKWREKLDDWTREHFNFVIDENTSSSHIAINLRYDDYSTNITDMGFGFSQILPIIVQLWSVSSGYEKSLKGRGGKQYIFAIEQPELHLHPKMQANLAEVFSSVIKLASENSIDVRLIIETHSSSMISKFGDSVALGETDAEDINIIMFEQDRKQRKTDISYSHFNESGELENWPDGFFTY